MWTILIRDEVENSKFNNTYHICYRNNLIFILRIQYKAFESILTYVYYIIRSHKFLFPFLLLFQKVNLKKYLIKNNCIHIMKGYQY